MGKKIVIIQSNYIPWKGYFDMINMADDFILYDDMQYTKNDWRNRNKIKTPNGAQWLTIPAVQNSLHQKINETKVADTKWNTKHWKTLQANYSKAAFFKDMKDEVENVYNSCNSPFLSEINQTLINFICKALGIKTNILQSTDFTLAEGKTERLIDLIKQCNGTEYISGPAAKDYLDTSLFEQENIKLTWMDYAGYPEYNQLFPPFEHGVTALDLIFNEGAKAPQFMKSFKND